MKATGSKLFAVLTVKTDESVTGEVYYDYERNLYAVFINDSFVSEHVRESDAVDKLRDKMDTLHES